jgi:hypothetical protein
MVDTIPLGARGLWQHQSTNDPVWMSQDSANQMWTAFFTDQDPLYDLGDYGAIAAVDLPATHIVEMNAGAHPERHATPRRSAAPRCRARARAHLQRRRTVGRA